MEIKIVPLKKWMVFGSAVVLLIALGMFLTIPSGAEASSVSCGDVLVADSILTKDLKSLHLRIPPGEIHP